MSDAMKRAATAKAFVLEMRERGIVTLDCDAFRYHLALLLGPGGHPALRELDSVSNEQEKE